MLVWPRRAICAATALLAAGVLVPVVGAVAPASAAVATGASTSSGSSTSRSSISLSRPAGTAAGNVMVAQIASNDDNPGFSAPAGWTLVSDQSILDAVRQAVYVRVAGASEPASYTWTLTDFRRVAGGITTYSGVDSTTPVDAVATAVNTTASTSVTAPSVTTTVPDDVVVHLAAINAEGTLTAPAGMTEQWEAASPNSASTRDVLASASDAVQPAAGATGAQTATATGAGPSIATLLALRPDGPPPPPDSDPPETTIDSGPSGTVATSTATFTFSADEPATFQCSLDGAAPAACSSPRTYTGVPNGGHTFSVAATDLAGNPDATAATRVWTVNVPPSDPVLVGAGDIASCSSSGDEATAALLDNIAGTVFTVGDNAYEDGTAAQYANCYNPTWGRQKSRTLPAAGNHEYQADPKATAYYQYFGAAAGNPAKGYYDTTVGAWHVIVLNSDCGFVGGCGAGSAQEQWLRSVLAASSAQCTVAIWHHPRFSSGTSSSKVSQAFWQALYDYGADVVINGHDHIYERFGFQNPAGASDAAFGLRQFTIGTGGRSLAGFSSTAPNSEVRNNSTYGVLKLTLHADSYDWRFVPQAGKTFTDTGTSACHGAPGGPSPPPPPPPDGGPITPVASTSSGSSSSRASISVSRPAGTVAGHVMVAQIVSNDDDPGFSAPAGWTLVSDRSILDAVRQAVYVKVAGASEPSSYTWTLTASRRVAGGITTYSGVDTTTPVDAVATAVNTTASTSVTAPSVTTTVPADLLVHLAAVNSEGTLTAPGGMTERWEASAPNSTGTRDAVASASDGAQATAGATGPRSATVTQSGRSIATLLALRPAP